MKNRRTLYNIVVFLITFPIFLICLLKVQNLFNKTYKERIQKDQFEKLLLIKSKFEAAVNSRVAYTNAIAAMIQIKNKLDGNDYNDFVSRVVAGDPVVKSIGITHKYSIQEIYPYEPNAKAYGLDLFKQDSMTIKKTLRLRHAVATKPFQTVQGGMSIAFRNPIFIKNEGNEYLYGLAFVALDYDKLLAEVGIADNEDNKYLICSTDIQNNKKRIYAGSSDVLSMENVSTELNVPGDTWELKIAFRNSIMLKRSVTGTISIGILALLLSLAFTYTAYSSYLKRKSSTKTAVMLSAITDNLYELDENARFIKVYKTKSKHSAFDEMVKKEMIAGVMAAEEIFSPENAALLRRAVKECLRTKETQVQDFKFVSGGEEVWYSGEINYLSYKSVICVSRDVTAKTNYEQELKDLNTQKDKFFSIIAHDLKNPVIAQKSALEAIDKYYDTFDENDKREYLKMLLDSANNVSKLLEDLLAWSRVQVGKIVFHPQIEDIKLVIENSLMYYRQMAQEKKIEISTLYYHHSKIIIDAQMISTILRNLVSNALKFTPEGGLILISTLENAKNLTISVKDSGVGIPKEKADKLFRIDSHASTPGTRGETGTGLGLVLCKEFVDKHNGEIKVISEPDEGSEFIVVLPKFQVIVENQNDELSNSEN